MKPIYVLNGPNLNLLGEREPHLYGNETLAAIEQRVTEEAAACGFSLIFRQTNHEGFLVDWIQEARTSASGLILNAGAYSHTSIAIPDALRALTIPIVEVHLSNVFAREPFRHHSTISPVVWGVICGFGPISYTLAVSSITTLLRTHSNHPSSTPSSATGASNG